MNMMGQFLFFKNLIVFHKTVNVCSMNQEKLDFKVISFGAIIASLIIAPVDHYITETIYFRSGWKFIFSIEHPYSVNGGLMFVQIIVVLLIILGLYHLHGFNDND